MATTTNPADPNSAVPSISEPEKIYVMKVSPFVFGLCALGVMLTLYTFLLMVIHLFFPATRHSKLFNFGGLAAVIGAWMVCWQFEEEEPAKKSDKKKDDKKPKDPKPIVQGMDVKVKNAIPDGYIGILEFMGIPLKRIMLTEGVIWIIPYLMSVKAHDSRWVEFQVPTTAEELGIQAITKDNVQVLVRVSVPIRIHPDYLYHALFLVGIGTAVNAIRNAIVDQVRASVADDNAEVITKANSQKRKDMVNDIKAVVVATARRVGYQADVDQLKIPKVDYADQAVKTALEALITQTGINKGVKTLQDAKDERILKLTNDAIAHGVPPYEAYTKARSDADVEFKLTKRQEILTGPGTNLLVTPN